MLLQCKGLTKSFKGVAAVSQMDLAVDAGEIVGLIGPNGAGKTTFFNLISGFYRPQGGQTLFKGENVTGLRPHQLCRKGIARTFQSAKPFRDMSVAENIKLGVYNSKIPTREIEQEVERVAVFFDLKNKLSQPVKSLTIEERKVIEMARALGTKPSLLLLDEPICGLNPTEAGRIVESIKRMAGMGIGVVIVEHIMKVIMPLCSRIVVMAHGEKIAEGLPGEIVKNAVVLESYFGEGYVTSA